MTREDGKVKAWEVRQSCGKAGGGKYVGMLGKRVERRRKKNNRG